MGIKRKIILGFVSIGSLLFLSGIISTMELVRFNRSTYELLDLNRTNIELSKEMLDAVQEQNTAVLVNITDTTRTHHDEMLAVSRSQFNNALDRVSQSFSDYPKLQSLKDASANYNNTIDNIADSVTVEWFSKVYKTSYYNLTNSIKEFMVGTQQQIIEYTSALERNAYRATMVGIIALAAGLLLVVLFYYMINKFFISPTLTIQRSLSLYLKTNITFDVPISSKDEITTLRDDILRLIQNTKK